VLLSVQCATQYGLCSERLIYFDELTESICMANRLSLCCITLLREDSNNTCVVDVLHVDLAVK
jgi:hypothetical protein